MIFDVTGGHSPSLDYILPEEPSRAGTRESASMWISDDQGRFGFPRFCLEAVAGQWNDRGVEVNIAFPDGRVLIGSGAHAGLLPEMRDGLARTLNAGPLTFRMVEPLSLWEMTFDGTAYETTVRHQIAGVTDGPRKHVRIHISARMAVPPWSPGEIKTMPEGDDAAEQLAKRIGAIGGQRHEQLFRCTGTFEVEGEEPLSFTGTGLRIHRIGFRDALDLPGHVWQSAVFPSGRAFGMMTLASHDSDIPSFADAFLFDGERMLPAKILQAPWMTHFEPHGQAVDTVLESEAGQVVIRGSTYDSTFIRTGNPMFGNWRLNGSVYNVRLPFHQGGVRYEWEGETTYGMIERSLPDSKWI